MSSRFSNRLRKLIRSKGSEERRLLLCEPLEQRMLLTTAVEVADLTDDGVVNILDFSLLTSRFGSLAGETGYLEGLDLDFDGTDIGFDEFMELFGSFGATGVATDPTTVTGRVFDDHGNPLEGVEVSIDDTDASATTDELGAYEITIDPGDTGFREITIDGSDADDATPDSGSGQYPTIPHKPIFINGGTEVRFRDMSLPERDLVGSVDVSDSGFDADDLGDNAWHLNEPANVDNSGVRMIVPAGCTVVFPEGEDPVLSITRVDPARVPIPMPPGLSSSLFVTYQPGGTEVTGCSEPIVTEYDNRDQYDAVDDADPDEDGVQLVPGLAGVVDGIFEPIGTTELIDADNDGESGDVDDILRATVNAPFSFAWYHVDIVQRPCARTDVIGQVKVKGPNGDIEVEDAWVSVPGVGSVKTGENGEFTIFNVPAGPNGPNCTTRAFNIQASASKDGIPPDGIPDGKLTGGELGSSEVVRAVPGGDTDVGMIFLGNGVVGGTISELRQIADPRIEQPSQGIQVRISPDAGGNCGTDPSCRSTTDAGGNYNFPDVPIGDYGPVIPGFFFDVFSHEGPGEPKIDHIGDVDVHDFKRVGRGDVWVTVLDTDGNEQSGLGVSITSPEEDLGNGYISPQTQPFSSLQPCEGFTDIAGMFPCDSFGDFFGGMPLGTFYVDVYDDVGNVIAYDHGFINAIGEHVEVTIVIDPIVRHNDIIQVEFNGPDSTLEIEYDGPLACNDSRFCYNVIAELDIVPGDDEFSEIDRLNFGDVPSGPTGLSEDGGRVDHRVRCFFEDYGGEGGGEVNADYGGSGECHINDQYGGAPEFVDTKVPGNDDGFRVRIYLGGFLPNVFIGELAVSSSFGLPYPGDGFFGDGVLHDVVPGNLEADTGQPLIPVSDSGIVTTDDPTGDVFADQNFYGGEALHIEGEDSANASQPLDQATLEQVTSLAIDHIAEAGASQQELQVLRSTPVGLADLPRTTLGVALGGQRVLIDANAAGAGWHVTDAHPAADRIDLLSVITHEFGHILGHDHEHGDDGAVMAPGLRPGDRRLFGSDHDDHHLFERDDHDFFRPLATQRSFVGFFSELRPLDSRLTAQDSVFDQLGDESAASLSVPELIAPIGRDRALTFTRLENRDADWEVKILADYEEENLSDGVLELISEDATEEHFEDHEE